MKKEPLVLCLTNTVAANFTANVLLAIGAKPIMLEEADEAAQAAAVADAMLVNLGTVHARQAEAMFAAVAAAKVARVPWVLDPVGCQLLKYRQELCRQLILKKPSIIRGNQAEVAWIRQGLSPKILGSVPMLVTGEVDEIWVGDQVVERISGGVPRLQTVTATGCAQGAMVAAFLAWGQSPADAGRAASRLMKRAGELAFSRSPLPGSFKVALVDALGELTQGEGGDGLKV